MNHEHPSVPAQAPRFPLSKATIWVVNLAFTPIAGAVMYRAWKGDMPEAAAYAKRVSNLSFLLLLFVVAPVYVALGRV
ncbi:MAG: hypothetical protein JNL08_11685 [Planctomycetes bacterium]|nr:hypothetical protein [Planctomycetota bacterium]